MSIVGMEKKQLENKGLLGTWSPLFISTDTWETRQIVGQGICKHILEHRSVEKRPVTVRYRSASLNKLTFHDMSYTMYDGEARIHVADMGNVYLCELNLAGQSYVGKNIAETRFSAGEIYMINAHQSHTKSWSSDGHQIIIKIHERDINAAIERATGLPVCEPVIFTNMPFPLVDQMKTLFQMINLVCTDIETEKSFFGSRSNCVAEELFIDLILESVPHNYSKKIKTPEAIIRPRHVRYAAEYIHSMIKTKINFENLVQVSGVSPRSLHVGFKKYYGTSPMAYLKNVRLDLARVDLKEGSPAVTTVTNVAMSYRFNHLSKFTKKYKARFGELPSETLRNFE
jgi:AraC-like DNA-binding protein